MTVASMAPKGRAFVRTIIARALGYDESACAARWGQGLGLQIAKAAVPALTQAQADGGFEAREFFSLVFERSIIGRLVGIRRLDFYIRMLKMVTGSTAYWVSEGNTKPISRPAMLGSSLERMKIAGVIATTAESLTNPAAEAALQIDLQRAVTGLLDESFVDMNSPGVAGERPASITNGVTPIASTGDPTEDLVALIAAFGGDLASAFLITDPETATQIALARDAGGGFLFPDCGPRGGSLLGIPLIVSRSSPRESETGQIVLIDPAAVALAMDPVRLEVATHTSLLMTDQSSGDAAQLVSLWQTNSAAFRAEIPANWELQHADSVTVITGATYGNQNS